MFSTVALLNMHCGEYPPNKMSMTMSNIRLLEANRSSSLRVSIQLHAAYCEFPSSNIVATVSPCELLVKL